MKKILCLAWITFMIVSPFSSLAQDWVKQMKDPNANFFEVQKSFNKFYSKEIRDMERAKKVKLFKKARVINEEETEMAGYAQFKRWEWFMAPRVSSNGERFDPSRVWFESEAYTKLHKKSSFAGNWTFIGPTFTNNLSGAGRLNFVRIDPTNANTIYVGSPAGGLWKSINGGTSWFTNTDFLNQVIGCTDIAIDPNNSNILYLATGDGDGGDNYSVGILKSTDGGATWNTTGLTYALATSRQISKLLIDPTNTANLYAATSAGIYKSTDSAQTFTLVQIGSFKDMEFKPTDPTTLYACGTSFYKSTNAGVTWTAITAGLPAATNVSRMAIGTSLIDPTYLYMIVGLPSPNFGTEGFYRSTNSGTSFTKISTPNIGNQQWYDLAIAASPTNAQEIVVGGQTQLIKSTNGGTTWSDIGGITHVDYHDLVYTSGNSIYCASDGGVYHTTNNGSTWSNLNNNLAISQMYGFGHSTSTPNLIINGWQDNGTNLYNGTWDIAMGGDGMLAFISHANNSNMWGSQYNGSLNRSTNGGNSWSAADNGISETGAWVTPWIEDPIAANTLWAGFSNVWKSTNGGISWTKLSNFTNTASLSCIAVSAADNNVVWTAKGSQLYMTSDGGITWNTISGLPSGTISNIACSNTDPAKAWVTYSGFANSAKVFQTNDQGINWINLSNSLPNVPINCVTYVNNSNDAIYIGTDIGVFYKDSTNSIWQPFLGGLPHVIVTQLAIYYPTGKLRASTYGRGMWESDLYLAGTYAPTAAFNASKRNACMGATVQFSDFSAGQPTSWNWSFPGGVPSSSNLQNPLVSYPTSGTFQVTLTATNANGADSITYTNFIVVNSSPYAAPSVTGVTVCAPATAALSATGTGLGNIRWWDAIGGGNIVGSGTSFSPSVTGDTVFYADEEFPNGITDVVGEYDYTFAGGANFTANDIRGLYFDVLDPVVLNTVDVYSYTAGIRTIEIIDDQGNLYKDTTLFIPASPTLPTVINLNITIYPGTNYFIKFRGLVDMYRNSGGAIYPYTSASINITGTNASIPGYYYFFYNWNYTTISCNTARTACLVNDTCSPLGIKSLTQQVSVQVFPNPIKDNLEVRGATNEVLEITIYDVTARKLVQQKFTSSLSINTSDLVNGIYLYEIRNSKGKVKTGKITKRE